MTVAQLKLYVRNTLTAVRSISQEILTFDAVIDFISQSINAGIPPWTNLLTFNNNGTGAGAFCTYPDTNGALRFWKSIGAANLGNQPPTNPAITSNAFWIEISPASGSAIKEWAPGLYGDGLIIVFYSEQLYKLARPARPFESVNIITEIAAADWILISSASSGVYIAPNSDVTAAPILLDSNLKTDIQFTGSAAISTNKTLAFNNDSNGKRKTFAFTITGTPVLTLPASCKMMAYQGGWTDSSKQIDFGVIGAGDFELSFRWKPVGAYFQTILSGPF